jgi:hypothetical protein
MQMHATGGPQDFTGCAAGRSPANNQPAGRHQRHLLSPAHRLSVAAAATGVPRLGYGLSLFPEWGSRRVWVQLHRTIYEQVRVAAGRATCPSVVIMDAQSVKTTERRGTRGFDAHKRVRGRKRPSWSIRSVYRSPAGWSLAGIVGSAKTTNIVCRRPS